MRSAGQPLGEDRPVFAGQRGLAVSAVVLALTPIAVAAARAIHRGWLPIGDNAYFALRARDVLTDHHPLLGTWTSASLTTGTNFNNPGPLLFDLLALPARLSEGGAGLAVGVALINGAAVVGTAILAHRRGGPLLTSLSMAVVAALCWSMGSEVLFEPWQPHSLLLPFFCFLMAVWSVACGDLAALPWAVAVGSLVLQTHLSYAVLVPVLAGWALLGLALWVRRQRRKEPDTWPAWRKRLVRTSVAAVLIFALGWAQPLVEQLTSDGEGNLTRIAANAGAGQKTVGFALGARLVATVTVLPPAWLRPSFDEALVPSHVASRDRDEDFGLTDLPSPALGAALLAVLGGALTAAAVAAGRRRDRDAVQGVLTATLALSAGWVTAAQLPLGVLGIAPHQFRWLWPIAAFAPLTVLGAVISSTRRLSARPIILSAAFAGATVVFAALNLPTANQGVGPGSDDWSIPVIRDLNEQLAVLDGEGPVLFDLTGLRFAEPYSAPVMAELQRRQVPFVVEDEGFARQVGPSRRYTGDNAEARLLLREGDMARNVPTGTQRVAYHDGLDEAEQRELSRLVNRITAYIADGRLSLTPEGEDLLGPSAQQRDPVALLASRRLVGLVDQEHLVLERAWAGRFERYAELQRKSDRETVALFLEPL